MGGGCVGGRGGCDGGRGGCEAKTRALALATLVGDVDERGGTGFVAGGCSDWTVFRGDVEATESNCLRSSDTLPVFDVLLAGDDVTLSAFLSCAGAV